MLLDSKKHNMAEEEQEQNLAVFKRRKGKEPVIAEVDESPSSSSSSSSSYRKIPETNMSFELKNEVNFLQNSIESLCDSKLNPELHGMVEVNSDRGFQITVRNHDTNVAAYLFLNPVMLTNFHCSKPLVPHMIYLVPIFDFLIKDAPDDNTLLISHSEFPDSNQQSHLSFKYNNAEISDDGGKSAPELDAPLIPLKDHPERFPDDIEIICYASIPSAFLDEMIQSLEEAHQVLMELKGGLVDISVGQPDDWKSKWQVKCRTGQVQGMQYDAYFTLPHAESIFAALPVDPCPFIYYLSKPEDHILVRFNLRGRGNLEFLSKAIRLDRKIIIPAADFAATDAAAEVSQSGSHAAETSLPPPFIPGITMSFNLSNAGTLRKTLEFLGDINLNPDIRGMVKVTAGRGLQIAVRNMDTGVVANLFLQPHFLTNFLCTQPLPPHMISFVPILESFKGVPDYDTIFISHSETLPDHESYLSFKSYFKMLADDPANQLDVPLIPMEDDTEILPDVIKFHGFASIPSIILEGLIQNLEEAKEAKDIQPVLIVVKYGQVEMFVGQEGNWKSKWLFGCNPLGQKPGMQYVAHFYLHHTQSIRRALPLDPNPGFFFVREPENHIMIRFCPEGRGDLVFFSKAISVDMKEIIPADDPAGSAVVESSQSGSSTAAEVSEPGCSAAAEASQSSNDTAEAPQPGGDAVEAPQPSGDAVEASKQVGSDAVEDSQPE